MKRSMFRILVVGALSMGMVGAAACDTAGAKPAEPVEPKAMQPAGGDKAADAKKPAAKTDAKAPEKDTSSMYTVDMSTIEVAVGTDGKAEVKIKAAAGYKVNEAYPWKAEVAANDGLALAATTFGKDKWALTKEQASLSIPVKAAAAGDQTVNAKLKFSICNEEQCELFKKDVALKVAAK